MNISAVDQLNVIQRASKQPSAEALRKAATQFEALLLMQLTSALNKTSDAEPEDGEENLFGSDSGTGLAKQMFSEQLATTMAQSGGIGLTDVIMRKFGVEPAKSDLSDPKALTSARMAIRDLRGPTSAENAVTLAEKPTSFVENAGTLAKPIVADNPNEAVIVSTFEDQLRSDGIYQSPRGQNPIGAIASAKQSRLAMNDPVTSAPDSLPSIIDVFVPKPSAPLSYKLPVNGRLSSGFGNRFHPIDKKIKFHAGLDLAVPVGTPVQAAAEGTVSFAGWTAGYGNLVIIQHADGRETRYGHLEKLMVAAGDEVSAGQGIGLSGSTGKSTGPHVHFEIRENGQVLDPLKVLTKGLPYNAER